MEISPLLSIEAVTQTTKLLVSHESEINIAKYLRQMSLPESIHILRFLSNQESIQEMELQLLFKTWRRLIPNLHRLNSEKLLSALDLIGKWWDAFGLEDGKAINMYDDLESLLGRTGSVKEGIDYFKWVALYPIYNKPNLIWDEHRRGAIISLGRYAAFPGIEVFLARHLDDWSMIQIDVIEILASQKSRLLPKLAHWYMVNDLMVKPFLEKYF